jgi:hypothetical protein
MNHIIKSSIYCGGIHTLISLLDSNITNLPNIVTCILFQSSFVFRSAILLYQSYHRRRYDQQLVANDTLQNLDYLMGYFIYDILYLLKTEPTSLFIVHHLIGLCMILTIKQFGAPLDLLKDYNAVCLISEITGPILNLRYITKNTPYYSLNMKLILFTYTLFRMIAFPLVASELLTKIKSNTLLGSFVTVYMMSAVWFKKIIWMTLFNNNIKRA